MTDDTIIQGDETLEDLLGMYWDVAYDEGHTKRSHGDKANQVLCAIRASVKKAVSEEREACAKVCDARTAGLLNSGRMLSPVVMGDECAAAIRARSVKDL